MLLANQILYNPFDLRTKVPLRPIPIKWFDMPGKLLHINLLLEWRYLSTGLAFHVILLHLDQLGLMNS
jgi:hypothetical protein